MTENSDDHSENNDESRPAAGTKPGTRQRHEPTFANFNPDEDDDYEEPDRDTDYASGYPSDDLEDDEYDYSTDEDEDEPYAEEDFEEDEPELAADEESDDDTWADKERFFVDEEETNRTWPLGLIAVAVIAIALLAAGGYGVVQQRTATENELRELRARLATTGNAEESGASREALRKMKQSYEQLALEAQALELENARLTDTVAGLETQLDAQQAVLGDTSTASSTRQPAAPTDTPQAPVTPPQAAPEANNTASATAPQTAAPAPRPADAGQTAKPSSAANASGPWFVNFGSYAGRTMAETWASRLKPAAGNVIISPSDINGKTLFRVRVIGLPDRAAAQQVARQLEAEQRVSELWVGKD